MNRDTIPYEEQIEAIAKLKAHEMLAKYISDERYRLDPRPYVKVKRKDLVAYFRNNLQIATNHLSRCQQNRSKTVHDTHVLLEEDNRVVVAGIDHGRFFARKEFDTLEDACAEYVLRLYGMPLDE
jgi:hypothetical protein